MPSGDSRSLWPAQAFGDGAGNRSGGLRGFRRIELRRDRGNVGIDVRQTIRPVSAEYARFAHGDVREVHALRPLGDAGPDVARAAVRFQRGFECSAIARFVEQVIEDTGAQLRAEKAAEIRLRGDVDGQPPVLGPA